MVWLGASQPGRYSGSESAFKRPSAPPVTHALTVKQPWAGLIAWQDSRAKRVENRANPIPRKHVGKRIAIHAGRGWDARVVSMLAHDPRFEDIPSDLLDKAQARRGVIVATARLEACWGGEDDPRSADRWVNAMGHHWLLADVRPIKIDIEVRGQLGIWTLPPEAVQRLRATGVA